MGAPTRLGRADRLPPVVGALLVSNILIYLSERLLGEGIFDVLALWPMQPHVIGHALAPSRFEPWQLVSYAFLHGSPMHLLFNMYGLWLFGTPMENAWGSRRFALFYFVCVLGASLTQLGVAALSGEVYPTIGASGGVYGILLAFGMTYPNARMLLLFPPVVLKAKWLVLFFGLFELWAGITGSEAGVAHFAHLGGMAFGLALLLYWRTPPPRHRLE